MKYKNVNPLDAYKNMPAIMVLDDIVFLVMSLSMASHRYKQNKRLIT